VRDHLLACLGVVALLLLNGCSGEADDAGAPDEGASAAVAGSVDPDGDGDGDDGEDADDDGPSSSRRERSVTVNVARAAAGDLVLPILAEGALEARHDVTLETELRGRVVRVHVEEGDRVTKGDLLVELDAREYRVALQEAEAEYRESLARLAAEGDLENLDGEALAALTDTPPGGIPPATDDSASMAAIVEEVEAMREGAYRQEVMVARSGVSTARAALQRARLDLERTQFRAPFDGVVEDLTETLGEQLAVGTPVCRIVDDQALVARLEVLESDLGGLERGRPVILGIPSLADTVRARVDVVGSTVDPDSRTCHVLLFVDNPDGRRKPGMYVRAAVAGDARPDQLLVPNEAILTRDGRPLLFKVEGDRAKWLYVQLGARNDAVVAITRVNQGGSLAPGDSVVVSNHLTLAHEAKVKVRRTVPLADPWSAE